MNIIEMLRNNGQAPEITEIERMAKSLQSRQKWAQLTNLQRCRIELGYASGRGVEQDVFMNPEKTLGFWLNDEGEDSLFPGVVMEVQKDGEFATIKVTDGREEFLVREEEEGLNITGVAKLGEAKLQEDGEDD